ncbi:MAG: hypothetical protein WD749_00585 [Phycisphaerales bacterium]
MATLAAAVGIASGEELEAFAQLMAEALVAPPRRWPARLLGPATDPQVLDSGAAALARNCGRLSQPCVDRLVATAGRILHETARRRLGSHDPVDRVGAAILAAAAPWPDLARPVAALLDDRDSGIAEVGEGCLRLMAGRVQETALSRGRPFRDALADAAERWPDHRRSGVFDAAIVVLDPAALVWGGSGEPLVRWFLDGTSESHMGLRSALRRSSSAEARRRAWEWLGRGVMATACLERVARGGTAAEHEDVLSRGHLLANPVRARRLALLRPGASALRGLWPDGPALAGLSPGARRAFPRFAGACGAPPEAAAGRVAELLSDADPVVRLAAARECPAPALASLRGDPEGAIARFAALRCPAAEAGERGALDYRREASRLSARRALASDRGRFLADLRTGVSHGGPRARVEAIMLARALGLQRGVELELLAAVATTDGDDRVSATAIAALADIPTDSSREAVRRSLWHRDGRARANAVDALCRRPTLAADPGVAGRLVELKLDPGHRARAAALRALIAPGGAGVHDGLRDLVFMLNDERPLHRLAALWAVERLALAPSPLPAEVLGGRWPEIASIVAHMVGSEPEEPVRQRAERCAARLLARTRLIWRQRAPDIAVKENAA